MGSWGFQGGRRELGPLGFRVSRDAGGLGVYELLGTC